MDRKMSYLMFVEVYQLLLLLNIKLIISIRIIIIPFFYESSAFLYLLTLSFEDMRSSAFIFHYGTRLKTFHHTLSLLFPPTILPPKSSLSFYSKYLQTYFVSMENSIRHYQLFNRKRFN